jgi:hypothetical protein
VVRKTVRREELARGPLIDDEAEAVELLEEGFDVAADISAKTTRPPSRSNGR